MAASADPPDGLTEQEWAELQQLEAFLDGGPTPLRVRAPRPGKLSPDEKRAAARAKKSKRYVAVDAAIIAATARLNKKE